MVADSVFSLLDNRYLLELCAVDNPFIRQLSLLSTMQAKQGKMVSFVTRDLVSNRGEIARRGVPASAKSIIDMTKLTPLTQQFPARNLLEEIAQYRAASLPFTSAHQEDWWRSRAEILMADYLLSSSLCYVEVFDPNSRIDKYLATRNRVLASLLADLSPDSTLKYNGHLQPFEDNYDQKQLKVLHLKVTKSGFSISQPRSYLDFHRGYVKVTPLFLMTSFVEGIKSLLEQNMVRFLYIKDNLVERELISTLSSQILLQYYDQEFVLKMLSGFRVHLNRGYVQLPELGLSKYDPSGVRSLNVSRITSIEVVDHFDSRFIEVDFNTTLPAFRDAIMGMSNPVILAALYTELTGQAVDAVSLPEMRSLLITFVESQYSINSTVALRHLHLFMLDKKAFFPHYNGGKPRQYSSAGVTGFNFGLE